MVENSAEIPGDPVRNSRVSKKTKPPAKPVTSSVLRFFRHRLHGGAQLYFFLLATVVGLVMGAVCALFRFLINFSHEHIFAANADGPLFHLARGSLIGESVIRVLLPALGGLIVGLLVYKFFNLSGGHGVPSVMKAIATGKVNLSPGMAVKSSTSIVTITSGGSCGPEGPIIEIGSVVGSLIGGRARATKEETATLISCGAAAGIAAIFNAPIGGVFLALELLTRDFAVRSFGPVVVAAVIGAVTSEAILPNQGVFPALPPAVFQTIEWNYLQLTMFAGLGILCGAGGSLFVYTMHHAHDRFQAIPIPIWLKPALGGLLVGLVGLAFPNVIGEGYEFVKVNILERYSDPDTTVMLAEKSVLLFGAASLLFAGLVKILATSFTLSSGGTGGSFAPAMVIGAMFGGGFGVICNWVWPSSPAIPVFALVGMAGTISSALNIPIAGILIAYEVSGAEYRMVLPLMITVAASAFVSSALRQGSIYTLTLLRDGFDVEEALRRASDPLSKLPVRKIMKRSFVRLSPSDNLEKVIDAFSESEDDAFMVVDDKDQLLGLVSTRDIRGVLRLAGVGEAIIASDAMDPFPAVMTPDAPASEALSLFGSTEATGIPVVAKTGSRTVVGLISRVDVLSAYRGTATQKD